MFERFTRDARSVVVTAQELARELGTRTLDSRHLLLALVDRPGPARRALGQVGAEPAGLVARVRADLLDAGLDADALASLGIDLDEVRRQADAVFGRGALEAAARSPRGHLPFTRDAKKALELALREAVRLGHRSIDSSHLLLGLLRADCPGRATLVAYGVDPAALRAAVEQDRPAA